MAYPLGTFKSAFWEADFLSQNGFDTLCNHIKNGQKSCKWLEEYLKLRAKAEEDYSKTLTKISKSSIIEHGSFGNVVDKLRIELETEASLHSSVAAKMHEESAKLTAFRENQKEERKRNEECVHKAHKTKADCYRFMNTSKNSCESRVKSAEKAESDAEKIKSNAKAKEIEKLKKHAFQTRQAAEKANEQYKTSVVSLEGARQHWENEHAAVCDEFQRMEANRIAVMRNSIWVFTNLVSDYCTELDESRERIRLVAEQCDEENDVKDFSLKKSVNTIPLQPIEYLPFGWFRNSNPPTATSSPAFRNHSYAGQRGDDEWDDDVVDDVDFTAEYDYDPQSRDEIALRQGDVVRAIGNAENGWLHAENLTSKNTGLVPRNYLRACAT